MNKLPDRVKMRREYLWAKSLSRVLMGGIAIVGVCVILFAMLLTYFYVVALTPNEGVHVVVMVAIPAAITLGLLAMLRRLKKKVSSIPYVPPVREQVAALPAEEILLRSSDEPHDDLLRSSSREQ